MYNKSICTNAISVTLKKKKVIPTLSLSFETQKIIFEIQILLFEIQTIF